MNCLRWWFEPLPFHLQCPPTPTPPGLGLMVCRSVGLQRLIDSCWRKKENLGKKHLAAIVPSTSMDTPYHEIFYKIHRNRCFLSGRFTRCLLIEPLMRAHYWQKNFFECTFTRAHTLSGN
jgi:hypothetical protein